MDLPFQAMRDKKDFSELQIHRLWKLTQEGFLYEDSQAIHLVLLPVHVVPTKYMCVELKTEW